MTHPVATTILQQLGGNRFRAMTGAKEFVGTSTYLMFVLPKAKKKIKKVIITLTPNDLYHMDFGYVDRKTFEYVSVASHSDVYNDMLQEIFTTETGLYTTL